VGGEQARQRRAEKPAKSVSRCQIQDLKNSASCARRTRRRP
jgi:hypothetical protein